MVIQVTYGEEIWKTMGPDLVAWNTETMDLVNIAFYGVWIVDIFPICKSQKLPLQKSTECIIYSPISS